jgi:predicted dehydrogenase
MGHYHSTRIKTLPGYRLCGIFDIDPERVRLAVGDGIRAYASKEEIASDGSVNAVLIATPNDTHGEYAEYFAAAGKHIICEKPASMTHEAFDAMAAAADRSGVKLAVHQNRRCDSDYLTAFSVIDGGKLGRVYRIDSRVMGANGIPGGWRKKKRRGGGMMLDWGVHLIDQICYAGFTAPKTVNCRYSHALGFEVDDGFELTMLFDASEEQKNRYFPEVEINLEVNTNAFIKLPRWTVFGEKGTLTLDDFETGGRMTVYMRTDELLLAEQRGNGLTKTMAARPESGVRSIAVENLASDYNRFYTAFRESVENNAELFVKPGEVGRVIRIMETAAASAKKGRTIKFKD